MGWGGDVYMSKIIVYFHPVGMKKTKSIAKKYTRLIQSCTKNPLIYNLYKDIQGC